MTGEWDLPKGFVKVNASLQLPSFCPALSKSVNEKHRSQFYLVQDLAPDVQKALMRRSCRSFLTVSEPRMYNTINFT